jgi:Na+/melibiose symporter-like transporter
VLFFVIERGRGERAMLDLSLFRIGTFDGICAATLLSNATSLAAIFLEVSYLQNVLGHTPWEAGLRLLPLTLCLFVAALTGPLVNKVPPGILVGLSISLIAAGMALITLVDAGSSWTALLPSMVVMGIGMGIFNPPRAAVTVGVAEPAKAGMASGMGETFQQVGVAIGIAAFGALFHARVVAAFASSAVATTLGPQADAIGRAIVAGAGREISRTQRPELAARIDAAARIAFVRGLDDVMAVCGVVCGIGAVIAFFFIRRSDLHDSATADVHASQSAASLSSAEATTMTVG